MNANNSGGGGPAMTMGRALQLALLPSILVGPLAGFAALIALGSIWEAIAGGAPASSSFGGDVSIGEIGMIAFVACYVFGGLQAAAVGAILALDLARDGRVRLAPALVTAAAAGVAFIWRIHGARIPPPDTTTVFLIVHLIAGLVCWAIVRALAARRAGA